MALLKFRCGECDSVFDELVSGSRMEEVVCSACGSAKVARAYEGKCLFGMAGSSAGRGNCSGDCASCGGCGSHAGKPSCGAGCACGGCV